MFSERGQRFHPARSKDRRTKDKIGIDTIFIIFLSKLSPLSIIPVLVHGEKNEMLVAQSCLTLCDSMDWGSPGSSVHGILQARILGLNSGLLHYRQTFYLLSHQESYHLSIKVLAGKKDDTSNCHP